MRDENWTTIDIESEYARGWQAGVRDHVRYLKGLWEAYRDSETFDIGLRSSDETVRFVDDLLRLSQ